eukprot:189085-Chlamydomonas_euryale.AAC.1
MHASCWRPIDCLAPRRYVRPARRPWRKACRAPRPRPPSQMPPPRRDVPLRSAVPAPPRRWRHGAATLPLCCRSRQRRSAAVCSLCCCCCCCSGPQPGRSRRPPARAQTARAARPAPPRAPSATAARTTPAPARCTPAVRPAS